MEFCCHNIKANINLNIFIVIFSLRKGGAFRCTLGLQHVSIQNAMIYIDVCSMHNLGQASKMYIDPNSLEFIISLFWWKHWPAIYHTWQKFSDTGPSFFDAVNSWTTFSSPLLTACISSAKYFNCICMKSSL